MLSADLVDWQNPDVERLAAHGVIDGKNGGISSPDVTGLI
jgi:hypothetical protein